MKSTTLNPTPEKIAAILRAGGHPIRVKILQLLKKEGEVSVNDIVAKINGEQSLTSHHLMLLTKAGYLKGRRSGKFIYYSIVSEERYGLLETVVSILGKD